MEIWATRSDERVDVTPSIIDFTEEAERFFYVPLWTNREMHERIVLNDVEGEMYHELLVVTPGHYALHLRYLSRGPEVVGPFWPLWSGEIETIGEMELQPASAASIERWRRKLENCLASACDPRSPPVRYLSLVSDREAANVLVRLLEQNPADYSLAKALARQCDPRYRGILRDLVTRPEYGERMRPFLESLAAEVGRSAACR